MTNCSTISGKQGKQNLLTGDNKRSLRLPNLIKVVHNMEMGAFRLKSCQDHQFVTKEKNKQLKISK